MCGGLKLPSAAAQCSVADRITHKGLQAGPSYTPVCQRSRWRSLGVSLLGLCAFGGLCERGAKCVMRVSRYVYVYVCMLVYIHALGIRTYIPRDPSRRGGGFSRCFTPLLQNKTLLLLEFGTAAEFSSWFKRK